MSYFSPGSALAGLAVLAFCGCSVPDRTGDPALYGEDVLQAEIFEWSDKKPYIIPEPYEVKSLPESPEFGEMRNKVLDRYRVYRYKGKGAHRWSDGNWYAIPEPPAVSGAAPDAKAPLLAKYQQWHIEVFFWSDGNWYWMPEPEAVRKGLGAEKPALLEKYKSRRVYPVR
jgi:hypothetical protein